MLGQPPTSSKRWLPWFISWSIPSYPIYKWMIWLGVALLGHLQIYSISGDSHHEPRQDGFSSGTGVVVLAGRKIGDPQWPNGICQWNSHGLWYMSIFPKNCYLWVFCFFKWIPILLKRLFLWVSPYFQTKPYRQPHRHNCLYHHPPSHAVPVVGECSGAGIGPAIQAGQGTSHLGPSLEW